MSRPDTEHITALKAFRVRLVDARRSAALEPDIGVATRRFIDMQQAIELVDVALGDEQDMAPLPRIDDPTKPEPQL